MPKGIAKIGTGKELPINRGKQPKLKISPKVEGVKQESCDGIAYEIKDKSFGVLQVRKTANAWWKSREKVQKMIDAFKLDCGILEMCYYAGISKDQFDYFMQIHKGFSDVINILREYPILKARKKVVADIDVSFDNALKYLERKRRAEFATRSEHTGPDGKPLFEVTDEQARKMAINTLAEIEQRKKLRAELKKKDE